MSSTVERGFAVNHPDAVVECFEATAGAVFATLCRVTVADRRTAEKLLKDTYLHLQRTAPELETGFIQFDWLILAANRLYLNDVASTEPSEDDRRRRESRAAESNWTRVQWGLGLDALQGLTPMQRVTLNLHIVEHVSVEDIAEILHVTHAEATQLLNEGERSLARSGVNESTFDILRTAELWLDDNERDQVREALTDVERPSITSRVHRNWSRSSVPVRVGIAATSLAVLLVTAWVVAAPSENGSNVDFVVPTTEPLSLLDVATKDRPPARKSTPPLVRGVYGSGTSRPIPNSNPTPGSTGDSLNILALHLTNQAQVRPDTIIKYSNGKVGITWTGLCNRPAARIQLTNLGDRVGLRLTTGDFPVLTCIGMPVTWAAVVETPMELSAGPILPFIDRTTLDDSFIGYSQWTTANPRTELFTDSSGSGSSLIDESGQAWTYVEGCQNVSWTEYDAGQGMIFESTVRDDQGPSCTTTVPERLITADGRQFPHPAVGRTGSIVDCNGPTGSMTSLAADSTGANEGQRFSTWDGCIVRHDVAEFTDYEVVCGLTGVRTITFGDPVGTPIGETEHPTVFLRDPNGAVSGNPDALQEFNVLPFGAKDSGLRYGPDRIWLVPSDPAAIYVMRGVTTERWPQMANHPLCP